MTFFHAIVLGIVEGVTELLPISSTAHMVFVSHMLRIPQTDFLKTFQICIQLGAIGAVAVYFWKKFFISLEIYKKLFVAFLPVMIVGYFVHDMVKSALGQAWIPVLGLGIGGVGIVIFERYIINKKQSSTETLPTYKQSLIIGFSQLIALFPGISRSAATIIGGQSLGLSRTVAAEFSFLLALPVMFAGTVLDIYKLSTLPTLHETGLLITGALVAAIVSFFSTKWFFKFIQKSSFEFFGWYRIVVTIVFLLVFFL